MTDKIKPDWELEQLKTKLIKEENALAFLRNMISADEQHKEYILNEKEGMIAALDENIAHQKKHEQEYIKRIAKITADMDKMLGLQESPKKKKSRAKAPPPPKEPPKSEPKKKSKKDILDEEIARLKKEAEEAALEEADVIAEIMDEGLEEIEGDEPSQTETTT